MKGLRLRLCYRVKAGLMGPFAAIGDAIFGAAVLRDERDLSEDGVVLAVALHR